MPGVPDYLALPAFLIFFVCMWVGIMVLVARLCGWTTLAETYELRDTYDGRLWRGRSLSMIGPLGLPGDMRNTMNFGASPMGLYMRPMLLFSVGWRPLLIPWRDMEVTRRRRFFMPFVQIKTQAHPDIALLIRESLAAELLAAGGQSGKLPPIVK